MSNTNSPPWNPELRSSEGKELIFDPVREKYVVRTPEEDVRQWFIHYLHTHLGYPLKCMGVERQITYNMMNKRFDILIFGNAGQPVCLIECKRPNVPLDQSTIDQVSMYNFGLKVPFLCLVNGVEMVVCELDLEKNGYRFLEEMPPYQSINK